MRLGAALFGEKKIFDYGNYREFLNDFYHSQKARDKTFSFTKFSKMAGFKAKSFLKLVIQGQRNLTLESIEKLGFALKLNKEEFLFFRNLVLMNQSTRIEERQNYASQLIQIKGYKKSHPLSESQYNYLSKWYFVAIRELVSLNEFQEDAHWISEHLSPKISAKEVELALEELKNLGLIRYVNGRLAVSEKDVATPDEVVSAYAAQYHREMLDKAKESIDRFKRDMREISATTLSTSSQNVEKIKEIIHRCRKEIIELAGGTDVPHDSVYQLNFQLFPLAISSGAEKKK